MKMFWAGSREPSIGIDIGTRSVKGIRLKKNNGRVQVENYFFHDLALQEDQRPELMDPMILLKTIIEVKGMKNQKVAASLDDKQIQLLDLTLPSMPAEDLRLAIRHELERLITYSIDDAAFDYVIHSQENLADSVQLNIKVYCTRLALITQQIDILKHAHLRPAVVESTTLANVATLDFNGYLDTVKCSVICDLGESTITLALLTDKKVRFINSLPIGLGSVNQQLIEKAGVSYKVAESIKHEFAKQTQETVEGNSAHFPIVEEAYMQVFERIQRSIDYYKAESKGSPIERIFLVGGGSQQANLAEVFQNFLKINTLVVNPFNNIDIYKSEGDVNEELAKSAAHLTTSVGLALRGFNVQ